MTEEQRAFQNKILTLAIIFSLIGGFVAGSLSSGLVDKIWQSKSSLIQKENTAVPQENIVSVVKNASPAVVSIIVSKDLPVIQQQWINPFRDFFGEDSPFGQFFQVPRYEQKETQKQEVGGGTGFIVRSDGLILTNKHVVQDEQADYTVLTNDGQKYPAKVLARDPVRDIAVIKIDKSGLTVLEMGDSDKIEIGQSVIAIGNALGEFRNTVSVGVVSGLQRSVTASNQGSSEQLENVIQTDAALNPGNSGGPLLDLTGRVIGINVAIAQGAQNIAFALPINQAKRDIDQIQISGKISYPYLGVRYLPITSDIKQKNNLPVDYGALLQKGESESEPAIVPGGPADKAGLKEGDIILEVNGRRIDRERSLFQTISNYNVGDTIMLKVFSGGQEKTISVKLEERE